MDTEEKNEFENELLSRISQMERGLSLIHI